MFTFNSSGSAPLPSSAGGGVLGAPALPVFANKNSGFSFTSSATPVYRNASNNSGSNTIQGTAVSVAALPVFGDSVNSNPFVRSTGILSGSGMTTADPIAGPPPPPPAYAAAIQAPTAPVFEGDRSLGSVQSFGGIHSNNAMVSSLKSNSFSGCASTSQNQQTKPFGSYDANQKSSAVFGNSGFLPPQPRSQRQARQHQQLVSGSPFHTATLNAPSATTNGSLPPPSHLRLNTKIPSITTFGNQPVSSTPSYDALGTPDENKNNNSNSTRSAADMSLPSRGSSSAAAALPLVVSSSFSSSFTPSTAPIVAAAETNFGRDARNESNNHNNSGSVLNDNNSPRRGDTQVFSSSASSFNAPFARAAKPAVLTGDFSKDSSNNEVLIGTSPPTFASANTGDKDGQSSNSVLGGSGTATSATAPPAATAPIKTVFGALSAANPTVPLPPPPISFFGAAATPSVPPTGFTGDGKMSKSAFGALAPQSLGPLPPPPAISSAFPADPKPSVPRTIMTSAFLPGATEAEPSTNSGISSAFGVPAGAAAGVPPVKSAFSAFNGSSAPLSSKPPAPPPAFGAAAANSTHGDRGGGAGESADGGANAEDMHHRTRGRGGDGGRGSGRRNRRHGRSLSPPDNAGGARFCAENRPTLQFPSLSTPPPRHVQQQQQNQERHQHVPTTVSRLEKLAVQSLPSDEKQWPLAARVFKSFLLPLASSAAMGVAGSSASRETDTAEALEQAFFGVAGREGVSGDFGRTAGEMLAVWQTHIRPILVGEKSNAVNNPSNALPFPGEMWVALFALGTYLNTIISTLVAPNGAALASTRADLVVYKAGLRNHPVEALTDACHYANELGELLQTAFQRGGEAEAPPYSILPVVLRRVRTVFDEANARGVATVQSNLNAVTSKLFAVLNRRVKASTVQIINNSSTPDKGLRWLLTYDSKEKESLLHSFAYLVSEMINADAPMNEEVELFVAAFHESLPSALPERCMLYYRRACALLRQPLRVQLVHEAAELLAKALAVYPPDAPPHNKRVLEVKLLTAELALGRLPPDQDRKALDVPQLVDVVNALKTSRLDLLDAALKIHSPFFVQIGVHNALLLARQRIALLMVVKYYVTHRCENRLSVQEMVRYHRLPYSSLEAATVWLLPLLVEKSMNGVLDHGFLILSGKAPFDEYPRDLLVSAAGL